LFSPLSAGAIVPFSTSISRVSHATWAERR
jgi:hypothetical protein